MEKEVQKDHLEILKTPFRQETFGAWSLVRRIGKGEVMNSIKVP